MEILKLAKEENGFQVPTLIIPQVFMDDRGYFFESYNKMDFCDNVSTSTTFVQDNESKSSYGVLRGLHFQKPPYDQAKLVRVVSGEVVDVAVDLRKESPYYKQYFCAILSGENHRQFFIPRGFAHGFVTLRDNTIFQYKCDNLYNKESEDTIYYDDFEIGVPWGQWINMSDIKLSDKDKSARLLEEIDNPF